MYSLILLACTILAFAFITYASKPALHDKEPILAPEFLPLIGHVRGLLRETHEFYPRISKLCSSPIFTIKVLTQKMYIVTTPELISKVHKIPQDFLSFEPVKAESTKSLYGASPEATAINYLNMNQEQGDWGISFEFIKTLKQGLKPGIELDSISQSMLHDVASHLDDLQPAHGQTKAVNLFETVRELLTLATTNATWGPLNPFRQAEVSNAFWTFESRMLMLILNPLPHVFEKSAIKARETVASALSRYLAKGGIESAPPFTKLRYEAWKRNGISDDDVARYEVGVAVAALSNTVSACFWLLVFVFSDPELLLSIRREIDSVTTTTQVEGNGQGIARSLDLMSLRNECPLLSSTFQEMLRFTTTSSSPRKVLQDIVLDDRYLLKKDALVVIANRSIHLDERQYGADAKEFRARRFLKGNKQEQQQAANGKLSNDTQFRTFGGGRHLCPGRHFATNETLAFCALFVARFDVNPDTNVKLKPPTGFNTSATVALMQPDTDVEVTIKQREGFEDSIWKLTLSLEEQP